MPYIVKGWCVHPCHDVIDPITGQNKFSKFGPSPTHPLGKYRLNGAKAADINTRYSLIIASSSKTVCKKDKICASCWKKILEQESYNDNEHMYVDNTNTNTNWINSNNDNNNYDNNNHNNHDNNSYKLITLIIYNLLMIQKTYSLHKKNNIQKKKQNKS